MLVLPFFVAVAVAKNVGVLNFPITANNKPATEARLTKRDEVEGTLLAELANQQTFYSVPMKFGSREDEVTVLVDTGSSDLWISSSTNPYCESSSSSKRKRAPKFDGLPIDFSARHFDNPLKSEIQLLNKYRIIDDEDSFNSNILHSGSPTLVKKDDEAPYNTIRPSATMDCAEYGTFDPDQSNSFQSNNTPFYLSYADNTFAYGTWAVDTVIMHDTKIENMNFALANTSDSEMGVLGIGLEALESTNVGYFANKAYDSYTYANLPTILVNDGLINRRVYSLFLDEADSATGNILFGGVDHAKYEGDLQLLPIVNTYYGTFDTPIRFELTVTNISVSYQDESVSLLSSPYYGNLDSGTTHTYFPKTLLKSLAESIGLTYSSSQGVYYTVCPTASVAEEINITFNFQGFDVEIPLSSFLMNDTSSNYCIFTILEGSSGLLLGDNFLRNLYVVYDLDNYEIALAPAKYTTDSDIEVVSDAIPNATKVADYDNTLDVEGMYSSYYSGSGSGTSTATGSRTSATAEVIGSNSTVSHVSSGSASGASATASASSTGSASNSNGAISLGSNVGYCIFVALSLGFLFVYE